MLDGLLIAVPVPLAGLAVLLQLPLTFMAVALLQMAFAAPVLLRPARPAAPFAAPPGFAYVAGAAGRRAMLRFYSPRWRDVPQAAVPGYLAWRRGVEPWWPSALFGGGGLVLAVLAPTHLATMVGGFSYLMFSLAAIGTASKADASERWLRCLREVDGAMARADVHHPSCPRCRLRERDGSGWCAVCSAALQASTVSVEDWSARVGSREALDRDNALGECWQRRVVWSFNGAGGLSGRWRRSKQATPPELDPDREWIEDIEVAYRDPLRPELNWVRVRERVRADVGSYDATRVQAWGFVDGRFAQAWVFAPVRVAEAPAG